ncbi:glycosyltransferase family 2 protein [Lapidilactobacillus dextrinicus]|uniref:glycosyltransferase family 2 protein n=1 Tax=Lapidilactobacillus dextrinicus TaxID=51664 RepID=UPI0022E7647A|nr:glycosyltransferase [Lapidilactobacillus dextrinicus]
MVVFVILHYLSYENTESLIETILKEIIGEKRIIVVDNASPNDSGKLLKRQFYGNQNIQIILNANNLGFANAMNLGFEKAKNYHPQFIILMNNDIHLEQTDFITRIHQSYLNSPFAVLGPDVYVPETRMHQNPKQIEAYTAEQVQMILDYNKSLITLPRFLFIGRAYLKQSKILKRIVFKIRNRKKKDPKLIAQNNIVLHGSILIFSNDFIETGLQPFVPETFFYFETEILDRILRNKKMISKFDPSIKVIHHQSSATRQNFSDLYELQNFQVMNMIKSTTVFLNMFDN